MTEENRISIRKEIVSNLQQVIHIKLLFGLFRGDNRFSYSVCLHGQVECSGNKQTE